MKKKRMRTVEYDGQKYTVSDLAQKFNINKRVIYGRLYAGLTGEDLVRPSVRRSPCVAPGWAKKTLVVQFPASLSRVTGPMQPRLGVDYIATPGHDVTSLSARQFYIVTLENGWPLVVYPNEFTIIKEAPADALPYVGLRDFPKYRSSKPYR